MNKKTLVALIVIASLLFAGIAAGVFFLYKGDSGKRGPSTGKTDAVAQFPLLRAVPSDAVAILCSGSVRDGSALLTDGTKAFSALILDGKKDSCATFVRRLAEEVDGGSLAPLRSRPMALSIHYSGSLAPLLLFGLPEASADSSALVMDLRRMAEGCGLASAFRASDGAPVLAVSASETLVNSSVRHQDEGLSIMANKDFSNCLKGVSGKDALFLSHTYAGKLLQGFFLRPVYRHADFFKTVASWTVISMASVDEKTFSSKGYMYSGRGADSFSGVFSSIVLRPSTNSDSSDT